MRLTKRFFTQHLELRSAVLLASAVSIVLSFYDLSPGG
jgi:hypothetical protein